MEVFGQVWQCDDCWDGFRHAWNNSELYISMRKCCEMCSWTQNASLVTGQFSNVLKRLARLSNLAEYFQECGKRRSLEMCGPTIKKMVNRPGIAWTSAVTHAEISGKVRDA